MEMIYLDARDNHKIPVYYEKNTNEKLSVQILHGLFDVSNRYFDFIEDLKQMGASVAIMDIRGHNKAIENASDSLYLGEFNGWNNATDDVQVVNSFIKANGRPNILIGHGMGADIIRTFIIKYGHETDGVVLVSPGEYIDKIKYSIYSKYLDIIASTKNLQYRSVKLRDKVLKKLNRKFGHRVSFDYYTSDLYFQDQLNKNPLIAGIPTVGLWKSYLSARQKIQNDYAQKYIPADLKILFVCGEKDTVGGGVRKQKELVDFYASKGKDATLKFIKNGRYDLYHDNTKEQYLSIVRDFIENEII